MTQVSLFDTTQDYCTTKQNSQENQAILEESKPRLNRQVDVLIRAFKRGMRISVKSAMDGIYDPELDRTVFIGDARARFRDILKAGYPLKWEKQAGNYRVHFFEGGSKV